METVFPADGGEAQTSPDATTGGMRFKVETVVESPTRSVPSLGSSPSVDGAGLSTADAANRTVGTIGYSTAEAVPMTMFYRNQESTNRGKARPTLAELHHDTVDNEVDATTHLLEGGAPSSPSNADLATVEAAGGAAPMVVKFGWIKGVLIRCLLNIWGVMLFLRLSWVVGQAGIGQTIAIILLASVVTVITTLSMSAICTNGEVKGGGAYYLISRSLGPEFGGAIGIIFSIANAVAVSLYVVGFAETVRDLLKNNNSLLIDEKWDVVVVGLITVTLLLGIALIGMTWEARAQVFLLAMLLIAVVSFFIGTIIGPKSDTESLKGFSAYSSQLHSENFHSDYRGESFFTVFAVFFPAATGILAGANISGDLKNPQQAIPKGTLSAIVISSVLYIAMAWVVGACVARDATGDMYNVTDFVNATTLCSNSSVVCEYGLLNTFQNMELVSGFAPLITAGIFSATLSSALASLVGAPKIFQAVCKDRIFPYIHVFAKGGGRTGTEPQRGYFLTYAIACAFILIGDLNAIAPIISNFFLLSYALINLSCFNASLANAPGWRPAFKYYNKYLALAGGLLCVAVMFVIKWWTALITLAVITAIFLYIYYSKPQVNWGSSGEALMYTHTLRLSTKLDTTSEHVKNYRPQILVFTGLPPDRPDLAWFAHCLTKDVAMMMCGNILKGDEIHDRSKQIQREKNNHWLANNKIKAFHRIVVYPSVRQGAVSLMQCAGLGKLSPNIVMLGFKSDWLNCARPALEDYVNIIHDAFDLSFAVAILRLPGRGFFQERKADSNEPTEENDATGRRLALASNISSTENIPQAVSYRKQVDEVRISSTPQFEVTNSDQTMSSGHTDETHAAFVASRRMQAKHDAVDQESLFCRGRKMSGTIDVYWLHDDGGLTILLPHLLTQSSQWRNCSIRVFTHGSSSKITSERLRMTTLMNKFRIEFKSIEVVTDLNKHPNAESHALTEHLPGWNELRQDEHLKQKLLRQVRIGECIRSNSKDAALVVVSLPIARKKDCSPTMYMSWLEALTVQLTMPVLMVRGNQSNVITFHS